MLDAVIALHVGFFKLHILRLQYTLPFRSHFLPLIKDKLLLFDEILDLFSLFGLWNRLAGRWTEPVRWLGWLIHLFILRLLGYSINSN